MKDSEDNLERFIRENRQKFDIHTPDPALAERMFPSLSHRYRLNMRYQALRVAAIIVAVILPASLLLHLTSENRKELSAKTDPQLRETEIYYETLMGSVFNGARHLFTQYPDLKTELMADISELENIGKELRTDLKDNIDNREVVEALIRNYRIRIQLLEDLLEQIPVKEGEKEVDYGNKL